MQRVRFQGLLCSTIRLKQTNHISHVLSWQVVVGRMSSVYIGIHTYIHPACRRAGRQAGMYVCMYVCMYVYIHIHTTDVYGCLFGMLA